MVSSIPSILLIEDEPAIRVALEMALEDEGYSVTSSASLSEAREAFAAGSFDLAIIDKNLPDGSGLELVKELAETGCATIIITAYASTASAVEALQLGVSDYLEKPFSNLEVVCHSVARVLKVRALEIKNSSLVSELSAQNEVLRGLSVRDPLTRLFNHAYVQDTIATETTRAIREGGAVALLFVDIDRFSDINSELGHEVGDQYLCEFGTMLRRGEWNDSARFEFRDTDVYGRFGDNRFAIVAPGLSKADAVAFADLLCNCVAGHDSDRVGKQTVSVGVAVCPGDASDQVGLIESAELSVYAAKQMGRSRAVGFSKGLGGLRDSKIHMSAAQAARFEALERSIEELAFDYVYQPIVSAETGAVFAYEALVRPRAVEFPHPGVLIETAELAGQIVVLGRALRRCSIKALDVLPADALLFVNIHPHELFDPEFVAVETFLASWCRQICFEITEVAALKEQERVRDLIMQLRESGFRIALDDLGSGYAGLNSLAMLEPDFVKLDMHLVRSATKDPRAARLVRHIVEFATSEDMQVVAEGIELEEERELVAGLGCQLVQGYLLGRPKPIGEYA